MRAWPQKPKSGKSPVVQVSNDSAFARGAVSIDDERIKYIAWRELSKYLEANFNGSFTYGDYEVSAVPGGRLSIARPSIPGNMTLGRKFDHPLIACERDYTVYYTLTAPVRLTIVPDGQRLRLQRRPGHPQPDHRTLSAAPGPDGRVRATAQRDTAISRPDGSILRPDMGQGLRTIFLRHSAEHRGQLTAGTHGQRSLADRAGLRVQLGRSHRPGHARRQMSRQCGPAVGDQQLRHQ